MQGLFLKFGQFFLNYYTKPCIIFERWRKEKGEKDNGVKKRSGH